MVEAQKRGIAVALLQEPYVGGIGRMKSYRGARIYQNTGEEEGTVKAAIAVFQHDLDVIQCPKLTTNNIVVVKIRTIAWKITLVSYYFEPSSPIEPYVRLLGNIVKETDTGFTIIGGDANAKSTWWGGREEDARGELMHGGLLEMGLHVLNSGDIPTFDVVRGGKRYSSSVDVTACSEDALSLIGSWRVVEGLTSSDHNGIIFDINLQKSVGTNIERTTRIYNTKKANWEQFHEKLAQFLLEEKFTLEEIEKINSSIKIDQTLEKYTTAITKTCKHSIPNKKKKDILTLPWWSEQLAVMKKEVDRRRRRIRNAALHRRQTVVNQYLEQKEKYEQEVKNAITQSWKEFCGKQDREGMWEGIYRVIGRTTRREEDLPLIMDGKTLDEEGSARLLAETFYPRDTNDADNITHRQIRTRAEELNEIGHDEHDPPFTLDELNVAVKSFNPKKAPGSDGFTADICARAIGVDPTCFLALLNKCLAHHYFPKTWKEATVVVLRKPGKTTYTTPKSYRPIGLLPVLGKIYEKMLMARLRFYILPTLSTRQYGFMPQRSTEDALVTLITHIRAQIGAKRLVTLVSLDIEGAFDSAWWPAIKIRLAEEKCPASLRRTISSYLSERSVEIRYAGQEYKKTTEKGCVQGSIGGPILWNLLLDPLLRLLEGQRVYSQAFADDVVLVFDGSTALEIEEQANAVLEQVRSWGVDNKLRFAPHKTCAMVLTKKLKFDSPRLSMGGVDIGMSSEIKILGLTVDSKLTFNSHVSNICRRSVGIYKQLVRAARVSWGLNPEIIKTIYTAAVEPIILYAAAAWSPAARKLGVRKQLSAVQRGFAQKMCKAYRTVSLNSALLLTGTLPLDLRVCEAASLYEARKGAPRQEEDDSEVEKMTSAIEAPHPVHRIGLEFNSLVDETQYIHHSNYAVRIFTDGSKIAGKVGAAISVWSGGMETKARKFTLSSYCTVYQAELLAISKAAELALDSKSTQIAIFSDSRAALETVVNPNSPHPLAVETRKKITNCKLQNKEISLFWIKAHIGLEGNERADALAKEAAQITKRRPDYDRCPVSFVKRNIRLETVEIWNKRYQAEETASVTKIFFPDVIKSHKVIKRIKMDGIKTQIFTGHGGFSSYLNRFKCKESPSCICEPDCAETVMHVITECPVHSYARYNLEQLIDMKVTKENIPEIMKSKDKDSFMKYCISLANKVISRNKIE